MWPSTQRWVAGARPEGVGIEAEWAFVSPFLPLAKTLGAEGALVLGTSREEFGSVTPTQSYHRTEEEWTERAWGAWRGVCLGASSISLILQGSLGAGAWGTRMEGRLFPHLISGIPTSLLFIYLPRSFMPNSGVIKQAHSC